VSGVLVLDVDGPEGRAELEKHGHPPTPMVSTPSGGLHLYFRHPDFEVKPGLRVAPGPDVDAVGGYVVAPPTVGANGQPYEWIVSPDDAEVSDPPSGCCAFSSADSATGQRHQSGRRYRADSATGSS
jgi:Bifunctional DNA primase/polymerase, N-terminal